METTIIPALDGTGRLPVGRFVCTSSQVYDHFVAPFPSERRKFIFDQWLAYNERLSKSLNIPHLTQWLNGSFVTNKAEPADLDLVTFVPEAAYSQTVEWLVGHYSTVNLYDFGLDAYFCPVFPTGHPDHDEYLYFLNYWKNLFGNSKTINSPKGFLEVTI